MELSRTEADHPRTGGSPCQFLRGRLRKHDIASPGTQRVSWLALTAKFRKPQRKTRRARRADPYLLTSRLPSRNTLHL